MTTVAFAIFLVFCALVGFFAMQALLSASEYAGRIAAKDEIRKLRDELKKENG